MNAMMQGFWVIIESEHRQALSDINTLCLYLSGLCLRMIEHVAKVSITNKIFAQVPFPYEVHAADMKNSSYLFHQAVEEEFTLLGGGADGQRWSPGGWSRGYPFATLLQGNFHSRINCKDL